MFAMAKMAESVEGETPGHWRRLQRYPRHLAEQAAREPSWAGIVHERFLDQLERCVPLHDIGKIGLPDQQFLKPGALDAPERALMETHTLIGDRLLEALAEEHRNSLDVLHLAWGLLSRHQEHFDGSGYPDRLVASAIPTAARLLAVADVYDALRRQRSYKLPLAHADAVRVLQQELAGQFDPSLLEAFAACQTEFARIHRDISE